MPIDAGVLPIGIDAITFTADGSQINLRNVYDPSNQPVAANGLAHGTTPTLYGTPPGPPISPYTGADARFGQLLYTIGDPGVQPALPVFPTQSQVGNSIGPATVDVQVTQPDTHLYLFVNADHYVNKYWRVQCQRGRPAARRSDDRQGVRPHRGGERAVHRADLHDHQPQSGVDGCGGCHRRDQLHR